MKMLSAGSPAFRFVLVMGLVNLFGDMTYEGSASINGPFLGSLGARAAAISIIAGVGEFLGYSLRALSGYIADRTGRHWRITFIGYGINLPAYDPRPFLASCGRTHSRGAHWPGNSQTYGRGDALLLDDETGEGMGLRREHRA